MSISFSGLGSGLDTASWVTSLVSIKQQSVTKLQTKLKDIQSEQSTFNSVKSKFSDLRSAAEKLTDSKFGGSFDLFSKNKATSSDEGIFTVSATSSAIRQSYDILVKKLATATTACSAESVSATANESTKLSALGVNEGTITFFANGMKGQVTIEKDDTVQDFMDKVVASNEEFENFGVNVSITSDGKLSIAANPDVDFFVGATTDSSNLTALFDLKAQDDGTYLSEKSLYKASTVSALVGEDAGFAQAITTGTFTIGDAEFTIDENTTLSSLIAKINSSEAAQTSAYWDATAGKLVLTSKVDGASYINIEAGTSNFTDVMGLTNEDKLVTSTQTLGENAVFTINGTEYTSTSNVVTSDVSRLSGITLTLKAVSKTSEEGGEIKASKLSVSQETNALVSAIKTFISSYNSMVSTVSEKTSAEGALYGESSLNSIKTSAQNLLHTKVGNEDAMYKTLASIGISTAAAGADLSADTTSLSLDEDVFLEALMKDPSGVKALLIGDAENEGVLSKFEALAEQTLDTTSGYFTSRNKTYESEISKINTNIKTMQERVNLYEQQLTDKFNNMDSMIAKMQQAYSSFMS